jgi:hypothetical protein
LGRAYARTREGRDDPATTAKKVARVGRCVRYGPAADAAGPDRKDPDPMPWSRLTDDFHDHPKVVIAGNAAAGLWARCLTWSARHLHDGFVPTAVVDSFVSPLDPPDLLERVERVGLMTRSEGGWLIPDFLDFNPSSAEVEAQRQKRSADAKRAADTRWDRERARRRDSDLRAASGAVADVVDGLRPRGR